ncbi:MAG: hypothetical protein AB4080_23740 [Trichodesmium sp.]
MRETSGWYKGLCKVLKQDSTLVNFVGDNPRELGRVARLIVHIELGLTLLHTVAPREPAKTVRHLLSGYRFPAIDNDDNWLIVRKARFYLLRYKGKRWLDCLDEYIQLPNDVKVYHLTEQNSLPLPSGSYHQRLLNYQQVIQQTPSHQQREIEIATAGDWLAKVDENENSFGQVPIPIPQEIIDVIPQSPPVTFVRTRQAENPRITINFNDLLVSAREMDERLETRGINNNYYQRLSQVELDLYDENLDDFTTGDCFNLDKILHIVGLLNVGKSTLLEVLTYHFAKQKKRCALIVNDVVSSVKLAYLFKHCLEIPAAPILGKDRPGQLQKVYEAMLRNEGEEIAAGGTHPVYEWFSNQCPLLSFIDQNVDTIWGFGKEPCHSLYQKKSAHNTTGNTENEESDRLIKKNKTCPFYYVCPRHKLERDIATAYVWILTPASFIHTPVPLIIFSEKMKFAEAVYKECDFLFVDEADRVQVQFDEHFSPDENLVSTNAFVNQVGVKLANINNSERSHAASRLSVDFMAANNYLDNAVNNIYNLLSKQIWLVKWLGKIPFYSYGIWTRIIRELIQPNSDDLELSEVELRNNDRRVKQILQQLQGFLRNPLNRRQGGELSNLADDVMKPGSYRQNLEDIKVWINEWLNQHNIALENPEADIEWLTKKVHFAILLTILDHYLIFLVDNLNSVGNIRELEDVTYSLVNRPPLDYLAVLPESPVGNLLGFLYKANENYRGGKLSYFRYVGVGRYLLLNFPQLFSVDEWESAQTILISGTSYAPDSPAYNITIPPTVLLRNRDSNSDIQSSQFYANPQMGENQKHISISGLRGEKRELAIANLIRAISAQQIPSFLEDIFQDLRDKEQENSNLWEDRERILLITGSYDESELAIEKLKQRYGVGNFEEIQTLRRDNSPAHLEGIRRGKIQELKDTPVKLISGPLMAFERGHNILNERQKAAFGAILFLIRPMPVPDDWQTTVRFLNNWALSNIEENYSHNTIHEQADEFVRQAFIQLINLTGRNPSFRQLNDDERKVLCATQAVTIWQVIGRGVRGGVPINVHFLDAKFAPNSAQELDDDETTSLLVGIIQVISGWMDADRPYQRTIAIELYGIFLGLLENTEFLNYEQH